jgi:hypothetical protein
MLLWSEPYFTYTFGSMGQTLESARKTEFFEWFHLEEVERRAEKPGEVIRLRPSGPKFRELSYLDVLIATGGEMVRMELVLLRSFSDGRDAAFAQDMVKSFLTAALPEACQYMVQDFIREISALAGGKGETPGFQVFRGTASAWSAETGWSRLALVNLNLPEGRALVVQLGPKPTAPNARLVRAPAAN